jgi:hypothetical protein
MSGEPAKHIDRTERIAHYHELLELNQVEASSPSCRDSRREYLDQAADYYRSQIDKLSAHERELAVGRDCGTVIQNNLPS